MSYVNFLLLNGFIPIISHEYSSFREFEEEASAASRGILREALVFHVLRSESSNAYAVKLPEGYFVGITDTLLQDTSFDVYRVIDLPQIADFFYKQCGYQYNAAEPSPSLSDLDSGNMFGPGPTPKTGLFWTIYRHLVSFLILHEIGHIERRHFDFRRQGATFCEFPEDERGVIDNRLIDKEFEADTSAAAWKAQAILRRVQKFEKEMSSAFQFVTATALLGALIPLWRMPLGKSSAPSKRTHPKAQERILNILFWFSNVFDSDSQYKMDYSTQYMGAFLALVLSLNGQLGWPKLELPIEDFRPWGL